jgi:putative ABC transport system permease protein
LIKTDDAAVASDPRIAAMDIGWAQQLLDLGGRITSIQIQVADPLAMDAVASELRKISPPDALIGPPARRGAETELMLAAFQLNLTALSLVSMVVGAYSSTTASPQLLSAGVTKSVFCGQMVPRRVR